MKKITERTAGIFMATCFAIAIISLAAWAALMLTVIIRGL